MGTSCSTSPTSSRPPCHTKCSNATSWTWYLMSRLIWRTFDPPYGSNNEKMPPSRVRYAAYYHVWTSVVLFDKPDLFGKANRRCDTADSVAASAFEEFRRSARGRFIAVEAIEQLIEATPARWTILSYSSGGRATAPRIGRRPEKARQDFRRGRARIQKERHGGYEMDA